MFMANLKALLLRIKSVKSIQKTTKVMQMISAAKLHKVQQKLENARKHLLEINDVVDSVAKDNVSDVFSEYKKEKVLLIVMSSDRGLCGNFNNLIVKFTKSYIESLENNDKEVKLLFFGKKAYDMMYSQYSDKVLNVLPDVKSITNFLYFKLFVYSSGVNFEKFDNVIVLFNKFYNTVLQKPSAQELIPCNIEMSVSLKEMYQYEPTYVDVISTISLGYILNLMYIAFLENSASEHCSRMIAMESANRNTKDMLNKLALEYNRSRQASITTDLIEIISGFESLN